MRIGGLIALTCGLTSLLSAGAANAEEAPDRQPVQVESGVSFASEYVWRGQSLTAGGPAIVGEVKWSHRNGAFAGIWGGNLDLGPGVEASAEIDYFFGWAGSVGRTSINSGYLYRSRPSNGADLDFQEITLSATYDFGTVRIGGGLYYSWDYYQGGESLYTYGQLRVPVGRIGDVEFIGLANLGHYDFSRDAIGDYSDWGLRLVAKYSGDEYELNYTDTNIDPTTSLLPTATEADGRLRAQATFLF